MNKALNNQVCVTSMLTEEFWMFWRMCEILKFHNLGDDYRCIYQIQFHTHTFASKATYYLSLFEA